MESLMMSFIHDSARFMRNILPAITILTLHWILTLEVSVHSLTCSETISMSLIFPAIDIMVYPRSLPPQANRPWHEPYYHFGTVDGIRVPNWQRKYIYNTSVLLYWDSESVWFLKRFMMSETPQPEDSVIKIIVSIRLSKI